jgi:hypothetical protein
MEWLSNFFRTPAGKVVGGVLGIVICWLVFYQVRDLFSGGAATTDARTRFYICSQTGKVFKHVISIGDGMPVYSPFSGSNTGYPVEYCYWNKDGTIKQSDPTPVLLNQYVGKPEPTFCPECGRLVHILNPIPKAGDRPPMTREEYERKNAAAGN